MALLCFINFFVPNTSRSSQSNLILLMQKFYNFRAIIDVACIFSPAIFTSATCPTALLKNNYNYMQVKYFRSIPGKIVRRDPANPTWDPRSVPGGIPPEEGGIPPGIPPGIMKHPRWDPALNPRWDPANPAMKSLAGSHIHPRWDPALNPRWDPTNPARNHWYYPASIPGGILPEIIGGISCLRSQVGIEIPSIPLVIIYQAQNPTYPAHKGSCQFHQKL